MNTSNGKCLRTLSLKSMKSARGRNIIAIIAIMLTAILFTTFFTIAFSINASLEEANFRQVGTYSHGIFKYLTQEQYDELKNDPLINEYGLHIVVGMPTDSPFHKDHVEISYCDANAAKWMYLDPEKGALPAEGTNEAATDTHVLELLGIEPEIGTEFTVAFSVDGVQTTETFSLCGWWEHDEANPASQVLIPQSRAEAIFTKLNTQGLDGITGTWNMDVMLDNSLHIASDLYAILANHGYGYDGSTTENSIAIGVNWGYTGSQLSSSIKPTAIFAIAALLLLIILTGYLT